MVPEAVEAARVLDEEGIPANVLNLTSPRLLFEAWQGMQWGDGSRLAPTNKQRRQSQPFDWLIPHNERHAPIVAIHDGASHALAWLGSVFGSVSIPLGVDNFGQSGTRGELYHHYGIDVDHIVEGALCALNRVGLS
jgi:pyruvate dehydrogenase E1 component